jgi:hypothetical protein
VFEKIRKLFQKKYYKTYSLISIDIDAFIDIKLGFDDKYYCKVEDIKYGTFILDKKFNSIQQAVEHAQKYANSIKKIQSENKNCLRIFDE